MGSNSATKLVRIMDNVEEVLGIELLNATQALEFRRPAKTSAVLEKIVEEYRRQVPFVDDDSYLHPLIQKSIDFLRNEDLIRQY